MIKPANSKTDITIVFGLTMLMMATFLGGLVLAEEELIGSDEYRMSCNLPDFLNHLPDATGQSNTATKS